MNRIPFGFATIVPDETSGVLGLVERKGFTESQLEAIEVGAAGSDRLVEREIEVTIAGEVCEWIRAGRHGHAGAQHDYRNCVEMAIRVTSSAEEASAYVNWLWWRTHGKMKSAFVWEAVMAVANALLEKNRLTSREVRAIVRPIINPTPEELKARRLRRQATQT